MDEESWLHAFAFPVAGSSLLPASPRLPWAPVSPFTPSPLPHFNPSSSSSSPSLHKPPAIHSKSHYHSIAVAGALKSSLPASPRLPWALASPFSPSPLPHFNPSSSSLHKAPAIHSITPKSRYHSIAKIDIISPPLHTKLHDNSTENRRGYSKPAYNYEKPSSKLPGDSLPCEPSNKFCIFLPHFKKSRSLDAGADLNVTNKARGIKDNSLHPNLRRTLSSGSCHLSANSLGRHRPPAPASNSLGGCPPVPKPNVGNGRPHITSKSSPLHSFYKQRREDEHMLSLKTSLPYRTSLLGC